MPLPLCAPRGVPSAGKRPSIAGSPGRHVVRGLPVGRCPRASPPAGAWPGAQDLGGRIAYSGTYKAHVAGSLGGCSRLTMGLRCDRAPVAPAYARRESSVPPLVRLAGTSPGAAWAAVSRPDRQIVRVQLVGVLAALATSGHWYGALPPDRAAFSCVFSSTRSWAACSSSRRPLGDGATLVLQCALALRGVPPPRHLRSWEWDWNAAPTRRCEGGFDSLHAESSWAA